LYLISNFGKLKIMKVVNYTDLRLNLKKWMDLVVNDVEELIIKRKNNKDLVLIPLDEYNSLKETSYLLTGKNREVLAQSLKEAKEGQIIEHQIIEE
jgi:antitoxin YefM